MLQRARASAEPTRTHRAEHIARTPEPARSRPGSATGWSGNQFRLRRLTDALPAGMVLQRKLTVGSTNDPLEIEADRTAERVVRMADSAVSASPVFANAATPTLRRCSCGGSCETCRREDLPNTVQRKASGAGAAGTGATEAPQSVHQTLRSPGRSLDAATRSFMEPRFGRDFGGVRVHTDDRAAESARDVDSVAYTVGSSIVFRAGRYDPHSAPGRRLLAHELAHVVQQSGQTPEPEVLRRTSPKDDGKPLKPVRPPQRVPYGSTPLSKEAIRIRRNITDKTGYDNLVVVTFSWKKKGSDQVSTETVGIWNTAAVAHSEQELDQYFRDFKENRGGNIEVTVHGIFSERQFCGPSSQNCQQLIYKAYPDAIKEYAYNYQLPPGAKATKRQDADRRNVVRDRIERFRDSGAAVDHSADRDPDPYDEASGGTAPGQVVRPPKKPKAGSGGTAPATDSDADSTSAKPKPSPDDKPSPKKPVVKTPPAPKPAADPPVPKKPATNTPSKPKPDPATPSKPLATKAPAKPVPAKPEPAKSAPAKPASAKSVAPKPATKSAPAKPAPASTPKKAPSGPASDAPARSSAPKISDAAARLAKKTVGGALNAFKGKLTQFVHENSQDKELNVALDTVDKAIDVQSFLSNPVEFAAHAIKTATVQGVFDHFSGILGAAQQKFVGEFPDVATLHKDPLGQGITLEGYEQLYSQARKAIRIPAARRTLYYAGVLLGTKNLPDQEILRRIEIANEALARQPDVAVYINHFEDARDHYLGAIFSVGIQENNRIGDLDDRPAGFADELRRRGRTLKKAGNALTDISDKILNSALIVIEEVNAAGTEIQTLGENFKDLGQHFEEFADLVGGRKGLYEKDLEQLKTRNEKINSDKSRPF